MSDAPETSDGSPKKEPNLELPSFGAAFGRKRKKSSEAEDVTAAAPAEEAAPAAEPVEPTAPETAPEAAAEAAPEAAPASARPSPRPAARPAARMPGAPPAGTPPRLAPAPARRPVPQAGAQASEPAAEAAAPVEASGPVEATAPVNEPTVENAPEAQAEPEPEAAATAEPPRRLTASEIAALAREGKLKAGSGARLPGARPPGARPPGARPPAARPAAARPATPVEAAAETPVEADVPVEAPAEVPAETPSDAQAPLETPEATPDQPTAETQVDAPPAESTSSDPASLSDARTPAAGPIDEPKATEPVVEMPSIQSPAPGAEPAAESAAEPARSDLEDTALMPGAPATSGAVRRAPMAPEEGAEALTDATAEEQSKLSLKRPKRQETAGLEPGEAATGTGAKIGAMLAGALAGLVAVGLGFAISAGCEVVRGTGTCGGAWGLLALILVLAAEVYVGGKLLQRFRITDPFSTSFLGVGLVSMVAMLTFLDDIRSPLMVLVIPVLTALAFLLSWWVTVKFVEEPS